MNQLDINSLSSADRHNLVESGLRHGSWSRSCSDETLASMCHDAELRTLRQGEVLMHRGETPGRLVIVVKGTIEISTTTQDAKRHVLGFLGDGQIFDLVPFFDGRSVNYETITLTDTLVLQLTRDQ